MQKGFYSSILKGKNYKYPEVKICLHFKIVLFIWIFKCYIYNFKAKVRLQQPFKHLLLTFT